jgi:predicted permease
MWRDLHFGFRQLRRNRLFSAVVIVLLALGIGANTLVFSLVNELLLKPLPIRNPENFYRLESNTEKQVRPDTSFQYGAFQVLEKSAMFSAVIAEQEFASNAAVPFVSGGISRLVTTQIVSPNYFSELGVSAVAGRVLMPADAARTGDIPAVLSYQFWQSQFNGSRDAIGRQIRLKNFPFRIAGVLPREFHSTDADRAPDIRLPFSAVRVFTGYDVPDPRAAGGIAFALFTRLAPGVSAGPAAAAVAPQIRASEEWLAWQRNALRKYPLPPARLEEEMRAALNYRLSFEPIGYGASQLRTQFARAVRLLMGGVVLLLFAVCANVAGLLLAKAAERRREIAIRAAVGAGFSRLVRQLLAENLLLAVPGAALGCTLALVLARTLIRMLPPIRDYGQYATPQLLTVQPDARILLFAIGITSFCVLAFGIAPAWRGARAGLNAALKPNSARHHRFAGIAPVALQVCFSVVLLAAAALMLRSWWNLDHLDPGFDRAHIVEFTLDPTDAGYTAEQSGAFQRAVQERVAALPGVRSIAWASRGVMRGFGFKATVVPQGTVLPRSTFLNTSSNLVTPSYFETMGIRLLAGRNLEISNTRKPPSEVVVNQAFVDAIFHGQNPVGKAFANGTDGNVPPNFTIAGVVSTAKYRSMREPDAPTFYSAANSADSQRTPILYVRTYGAPASIVNAVRRTMAEVDAGVPLVEVATLEQEIQASLWQERLVALLSAFFGVIALAAIGIYGALAFSVGRRTRELGIRIAVGARVRHIVGTVCAPVLIALACGIATGLLASVFLLRWTERLLFGVRPVDPGSFAAAAVFLLACAVASAAIPTFRAIRIPPSSALREE